MSTDIVKQNGSGRDLNHVPAASPFSGDKEAFNTGVRIANALSESDIVPTTYRGKIANVLVAMEYANRLGASVLAVMQNCDMIHNRPSMRATFLIGTVNATGRFTPIRWRFQGEEGTDEWGARAVAKDREDGEECVGPLVTIGLAKKEGWYSKSGSKWQTIPELMLMYRSAAWWTRLYCPEKTLGLTTDEMEDLGPGGYPAVTVDATVATSPAAALNERLLTAAADGGDADESGVAPEAEEQGSLV
jgi:hypothetical protein